MTDVEFDTKKFKHSTTVLYLCIAASVLGGYLVGWFSNESSEARLYCTLIAIVFVWGLKVAKVSYVNNLTAYSELVRLHREDEIELGKQYCDNMKDGAKSQIAYPFTSEDFDETAQQMIIPHVDKARKNNTVINGPALIKAFLKGIH